MDKKILITHETTIPLRVQLICSHKTIRDQYCTVKKVTLKKRDQFHAIKKLTSKTRDQFCAFTMLTSKKRD